MSPCPDLLCPLVANKGVETEEVTPVPPPSAQGWHSRAQSWPSSAEEAPRDFVGNKEGQVGMAGEMPPLPPLAECG